jgi:flagellar biosynthesis chaperone FliJ
MSGLPFEFFPCSSCNISTDVRPLGTSSGIMVQGSLGKCGRFNIQYTNASEAKIVCEQCYSLLKKYNVFIPYEQLNKITNIVKLCKKLDDLEDTYKSFGEYMSNEVSKCRSENEERINTLQEILQTEKSYNNNYQQYIDSLENEKFQLTSTIQKLKEEIDEHTKSIQKEKSHNGNYKQYIDCLEVEIN